jgi:hypothetical protein
LEFSGKGWIVEIDGCNSIHRWFCLSVGGAIYCARWHAGAFGGRDESRPYRVKIVHTLSKVALQFRCVKNIEISEITLAFRYFTQTKGSLIHATTTP